MEVGPPDVGRAQGLGWCAGYQWQFRRKQFPGWHLRELSLAVLLSLAVPS
jgi:hypothetical protein